MRHLKQILAMLLCLCILVCAGCASAPLPSETADLSPFFLGGQGGVVIDDSWRENDGLVNTISSYAPFGAPAQTYDPANIRPGVWNEMPVFPGDHMSIIGGMTIKKDVRPFYLDLLQMIDNLPQT